MVSKINLKAKIERHSRILKDNLLKSHISKNKYSLSYKIVLFIIVVIFPFYPALASLVYDNSVIDFYRGDIDQSSILKSYQGIDGGNDNTAMFESDDGNFLSISTISDGSRDLKGTNEIVNYEVKYGDSVASIASNFGVSRNSIFWANNFTDKTIIHPGDKVKIPPVSGLIHKVKKGDTISSLATKYDVNEEKILKQNLLTSEDPIKIGDEIVIPGGIKKVVVPIIKESKKLLTNNNTGKKNTYAKTGYSYVDSKEEAGEYSLTKRTAKRSFYRGNCTRFVAQYKNVTWGGNAKDWFRNAKANGVDTGYSPTNGSIVVFNGKGYNPAYGHVGIVTSVGADHIIVKDMNYRALNEVTVRKVYKSDSSIKGYIYVE
ncbi:MAG: LysM peptidoglycan-binding domain-containing protein [Candidatus Gracilibacteria bacterium]